MGKPSFQSADLAVQVVTAEFTAAGQVTAAACFSGAFNLFITGTFVGEVGLEISYDGGASWAPMTSLGAGVTFAGRCAEALRVPELGLLIRARCTAFTSGTIIVRLSQ